MSHASGISSLQQAVVTPSEVKPAVQESTSGKKIYKESLPDASSFDQTSLSSTGSLVAHALESSDVRSAKVASLQQAIAAGTYSVSSSDVADRIIQSLLK
jgi:negative regulator of flagellin synthesis FlgM